MSEAKLRSYWLGLLPSHQSLDTARSDEWWVRLRDHYSEGARQYHTLQHIDKMFSLFEEYKGKLTSPETVSWAIFFHDVIYNPKASDNEDKSAELFQAFASECLPDSQDSMVQRVNELILMTKTHSTEPHRVPNMYGEADEHYLLDFDMQVLGWPDADYDCYAQQIRQEYIHVPEEQYCRARAQVLTPGMASSPSQVQSQILKVFLKTANIYATRAFRELYEDQARANIEREIQRLVAG